MSRPAALLDRDGTLNKRPPPHSYVTDQAEFELLPGAIEGATRLARCGYALAVVSNQRGISLGLISEATLRETEAILGSALEEVGDAQIAGFYYCPHLVGASCSCRKPRPGLLLRAAEELDLDLAASWMIGDSPSDILAGAEAGCRTAFIGPEGPGAAQADMTAASLYEVAELICAEPGRGR